MKLLRRNLIHVQYLPWTGKESDLNEDQVHSGEFYPIYGDPIPYSGNFSVPSGNTNPTFYGSDIRYTHVLLIENPKADINEFGLFRINGKLYEIRAVRPSLNGLSIALRKTTGDYPGVPPETGTVTDDEQSP